MARIPLKVVVDDDHILQTEKLSQAAARAGLSVESVMPEIGVIYGSGEESLIDTLSQVEGVQDVDRETDFQLPPMSESIPQ
jgi:hypothetical protein